MKKKLLLDIKEIFYQINSELASKIPDFVYSLLKKIMNQKEINSIYNNNIELMGMDFVEGVLQYMNINVTYEGLENIPIDGKYIFAANHPTSGVDGLALSLAIGKKFNENFKFIATDTLLKVVNLNPIFTYVTKHGRQKRNYVLSIKKAFQSDNHVVIFPYGLLSRKVNGKIMDLDWNNTFIQKAKQYKREIIPVHISGQSSNIFYVISSIRKRLRIKTNLEEFLVASEFVKGKDKDIHVKFGKPIPYTFFDSSKSIFEWSQYVKEIVYQL